MQTTEMPKKGEEIGEIVTNYGTIKVKFFPDIAPKAVENFKTHGKNGYYNGVTFHRIIEEFMIQGGDPEGTGMGGEAYGVALLKMNLIYIIEVLEVLCPWLTVDLIQMEVNFS